MKCLLLISRASAANPLVIVLSAVSGAAAMTRLRDSVYEAFWWFVPCLFVIIADLTSGVHAAKSRGETVRFSTAARRTVNKIVCYLCWIIVCVGAAKNFGNHTICLCGMGFIFLVEGVSFINNILEPKGVHLSIRGILKLFGERKGVKGLENIIEKNDEDKQGL